MKKITIITMLFLFFSVSIFAQEAKQENPKLKQEQAANKKDNIKKIVLNVAMSCADCEAKVKKQLAFEKGVKDVVTNLKEQTVTVTYDTRKTTSDILVTSVKSIGYAVKIAGSSCAKSCPNATQHSGGCCNKNTNNTNHNHEHNHSH